MFYNEIASSKTVLPTVHLGPPPYPILRTPPFRTTSAESAPPVGLSSGVGMVYMIVALPGLTSISPNERVPGDG